MSYSTENFKSVTFDLGNWKTLSSKAKQSIWLKILFHIYIDHRYFWGCLSGVEVEFESWGSVGVEHVDFIMKSPWPPGGVTPPPWCRGFAELVRTVIKLVFKPRLFGTFELTQFKITRNLEILTNSLGEMSALFEFFFFFNWEIISRWMYALCSSLLQYIYQTF